MQYSTLPRRRQEKPHNKVRWQDSCCGWCLVDSPTPHSAVRLSGGEDGDAKVTAGKYIGDKVFVGVEQGATAESGGVSVEVELTPNISVESGVGQTGDSNVGVKFKWDY